MGEYQERQSGSSDIVSRSHLFSGNILKICFAGWTIFHIGLRAGSICQIFFLGLEFSVTPPLEAAVQCVLDARARYPESSLAVLYDPLTMPPDLAKAHQKLDAAVDKAYRKRKFTGDRDRQAFLFELYQELTNPLLATENRSKRPGK
jgi:hypothetical protein